jgi:hypothetical protein
MALDTNVAELSTQTTYLTNAINIKKATLDAQVATAAAYVTDTANSATTLATTATTLASTAASTKAASDTALAAWQNSTDGAEALPAINVNSFNGTVVASCVYDTSLDSDGGQWRKRCTATSWYNEVTTATGKWLGCFATPLLAVNSRANSAVGDYYYNTTDKLFYSIATITGVPVSATVATGVQIYRGARKEFPEIVAITAEAGRVIIWDLTVAGGSVGGDAAVPMWMVFTSNTSYMIEATQDCICAINGAVFIGSTTGGAGLKIVQFIIDSSYKVVSNLSLTGKFLSNIAGRRTASGFSTETKYGSIVNNVVNSITATILPTAPIDPATGLPVPTIAVGTAGGVSVIKDDGTVVNGIETAGAPYLVSFTPAGNLVYGIYNNVIRKTPVVTSALTSGFGYIDTAGGQVTSPNGVLKPVASKNGTDYNASWGICRRVMNSNAAYLTEIYANITNTYNTGWMNGDIRLAALADSDRMAGGVETVSGAELMPNGNFNADATTSGWTVDGTGTFSTVAGVLVIDATINGYQGASWRSATPIVSNGQSYTVTFDMKGSAASVGAVVLIADGYVNICSKAYSNTTASMTTYSISGVVNDSRLTAGLLTILRLQVYGANPGTVYIDNISIKLSAADRSVKANPLTVVGTLTKSPVNTGSQLVAYSGYATGSYLMQPYSTNLDFGTGDFSYNLWAKSAVTSVGPNSPLFTRGTDVTSSLEVVQMSTGISVRRNVAGTPYVTTLAYSWTDSNFHKVDLVRRSGVLYLYLDGVQQSSAAFTADMNWCTSPLLMVGMSYTWGASTPLLGAALFRISATAPSADQIQYMYETERKLFEPGAQCTIQGTSTYVTAMDYSDQNDLLHVGTSWGITEFQGLKVNTSYATSMGAVSAISTKSGYEVISGATSTSITAPSKLVRDELNRAAEMKKQFGQDLVYVDFDSIAAQTTFVVPLGMKAKYVYAANALKRQGAAKDFTITNDGFRDSVVFTTAPGTNVWVSVACTRV